MVCFPLFRKILVSVKFSARNSGAGNGCANFMGEKCVLSAGKSHVHKIPRFRGRGDLWFWGGKCRFYFYGREDFSEKRFSQREKKNSFLGEAQPGVSKPGGFPTFCRERSRLCRGPFRDCSSWVLSIGRESGKGQIRKIPGQSPDKSEKKIRKVPKRTSEKSQKGQKKKDKSRSGNHPRLAALTFASLAIWGCAIRIASHIGVASRDSGH